MSTYLAFGELISNFMLRDAVHLSVQISTAKPPTASKQCPASNQSDSGFATWQLRAFKHAKLVHQGLALHRSNDAAKVKAKDDEERQLPVTQSHFRLYDLPAEIRDMIFDYIFIIINRRAPKLLCALRGNQMVWDTAIRAYCKVNNFSISLGNGSDKKGVEAMPDKYVQLVRNLTVVVPKSTQQSIPFITRVTLSNIKRLTLQVTTEPGLRIAAYSIIPQCAGIERLTVVIKNAKDRQRPGGLFYREAFLHSFREAIRTIDKILGVEGRSTESNSRRHKKVWTWRAVKDGKGGKRFKMTSSSSHVRFE